MRHIISTLVLSTTLLLSATGYAATSSNSANTGTLFQVATVGALLEGVHSSDYTFQDLAKHGDFGIGTFENIDGEMLALNGKFYKILPDGKLKLAEPNQKAPYADVVFFKPTISFKIKNISSFAQLKALLKKHFNSENIPYAVKITGMFPKLRLRTINPGNPNLVDHIASSRVYHMSRSMGTILGFYIPQYWTGIGIPGFYLHFANQNMTYGGHLLGLTVTHATVELQPLHYVQVYLPNTTEFKNADLQDSFQKVKQKIQQLEKHYGDQSY